MKRVIYETLRFYVRLGLWIYFRKVIVENIENIPTDKPVLFTANHQNAFLDALLIVAFNKRHTYFLARASIFGNFIIDKLLSLINMLPIYRIRDGKHTLVKNEKIFQQCYGILDRGNTLLIFPEGNHDMKRRLRPLSKGFTRIVFGTLENTSLSEINIIPVGINYENHQRFRSRVALIFGKPVKVTHSNFKTPIELRERVSFELKQLITHIEDDYDTTIHRLERSGVDYLKPKEINNFIKSIKERSLDKSEPNLFKKALHFLGKINNILVLSVWNLMKRTIKDPVFIGSIKFTFGIFIVPIIYLFQGFIIYLIGGTLWAFSYLLFSFISVRWMASLYVK